MIIKVFWKSGCPNCPQAKELGNHLKEQGIEVELHNIGNMNGLAEAAFFDVMSTPTIVITNGNKEIKSWRGEVPTIDEIKKVLS